MVGSVRLPTDPAEFRAGSLGLIDILRRGLALNWIFNDRVVLEDGAMLVRTIAISFRA